jgi:hypothetical protein
VKPEREQLQRTSPVTISRNREYWWNSLGPIAQNMRHAIAPLRRVLVRSRVSELTP